MSTETNTSKEANFSMETLRTFLGHAEPLMSKTLMSNLQSTAFDGYSASIEDQVHEISLANKFKLKRREIDSVCTQVAWNKSGSSIAVAYGRFDHESWCTHKGNLAIFNISRNSPDTPTFSTEVSSCLMCIAFHPDLPSVIAGGTFSGQVMVWQTNDSLDNSILASSRTYEMSHEEPVSSVSWVPGNRAGEYNVFISYFYS
jgi:WD40 repeat protein